MTGHEGADTAASGTPYPVELGPDRASRGIVALFLAGPLIGMAHFLVVYLVAEAGCTGEGPGLRLLDPPVPVIVTLVATVVAAVGCVLAALAGVRRWRRASGDDGRDGSLGFMGAVLSGIFLATVLFVGVPAPFLSSPC